MKGVTLWVDDPNFENIKNTIDAGNIKNMTNLAFALRYTTANPIWNVGIRLLRLPAIMQREITLTKTLKNNLLYFSVSTTDQTDLN